MDPKAPIITSRTPQRKRLTLTVTEAADILGISRSLAYEMAKDGRLPTVALDARHYVIPRSTLERMLTK